MFSIKQIVPHSATSNCITSNLISPDEEHLIVAKYNELQIYSLVEAPMEGDEMDTGKRRLLSLSYSTKFYAEITSLASVKTKSTDRLLVAFGEKVSTFVFNASKWELEVVSLHCYTIANTDNALSELSLLESDPSSRCAALLCSKLAIIPFPSTLEEETTQMPSYLLDINSVVPTKSRTIQSMCFLDGYFEPTLALLYSTKSSHVLFKRTELVVVSIANSATVTLLSKLEMPHDSLMLYPIKKPLGGMLVIGVNFLLYSDGTRSSLLKLNEYSELSGPPALPGNLAGCRVVQMGENEFLLSTPHNTFVLRVEKFGMTKLTLSKLDISLQGQCMTMFRGLLFIGSCTGDDLLLEVAKKMTSAVKQETSELDELDLLLQAESKEEVLVTGLDEVDRIKKWCRVNDATLRPGFETTLSTGFGKESAVVRMKKQIDYAVVQKQKIDYTVEDVQFCGSYVAVKSRNEVTLYNSTLEEVGRANIDALHDFGGKILRVSKNKLELVSTYDAEEPEFVQEVLLEGLSVGSSHLAVFAGDSIRVFNDSLEENATFKASKEDKFHIFKRLLFVLRHHVLEMIDLKSNKCLKFSLQFVPTNFVVTELGIFGEIFICCNTADEVVLFKLHNETLLRVCHQLLIQSSTKIFTTKLVKSSITDMRMNALFVQTTSEIHCLYLTSRNELISTIIPGRVFASNDFILLVEYAQLSVVELELDYDNSVGLKKHYLAKMDDDTAEPLEATGVNNIHHLRCYSKQLLVGTSFTEVPFDLIKYDPDELLQMQQRAQESEDVLVPEVQPPKDYLPTIRKYTLDLYSFTANDEIALIDSIPVQSNPPANLGQLSDPFCPHDQVLALEILNLDVLISGNIQRKQFVGLGLGNIKSEDYQAKGAIVLYEVILINPRDKPHTNYKLKLIKREESKQPVTSLVSLDGYIFAAIGQKIMVYTFEDQTLTATGFYDVYSYITQMKSIKSFLITTDVLKSLSMFCYQAHPARVEMLGRDSTLTYASDEVVCCNYMVDGDRLFMTDGQRIFEYNPFNLGSQKGKKLVRVADFKLGTNFIIRVPNTSSHQRTSCLYVTNDSVSLVQPLSERSYKRLESVYSQLLKLKQRGGCNHREFVHCGLLSARNVVDADYLYWILENTINTEPITGEDMETENPLSSPVMLYGRQFMVKLVRDCGSSYSRVLEDVREIENGLRGV